MNTFRRTPLALSLVAASSLFLAACSDDDSSASSSTPPPPAATSTGVLTDAPIAGVSYLASPSGKSGVTLEGGLYEYVEGDTVTFTLGTLALGTTLATGIVSPIDLAGTDENKLTNLLVLLQTLDDDGDASNGITILPIVATAVPNTINLSVDPVDFANPAVNTALDTLADLAGNAIVTPEAAAAHFMEQGLVLLANKIWVAYDDTTAMMLRSDSLGEYLIGTAEPDDYSGYDCGDTPESCVPAEGAELISQAGVEYGDLVISEFNTYGYFIEATAGVDTNLQGGISHPLVCDYFKPQADQLLVGASCPDGGAIDAAPNTDNGLAGVWALDGIGINTQHLVFLPNGRFLMVDPIGDEDPEPCGGPGVEYASYTLNPQQQIVLGTVYYDTNGCAGLITDSALNADSFTLTLSGDGLTLELQIVEDGGAFSETRTLYRVSGAEVATPAT